jgi:hypothetical protein
MIALKNMSAILDKKYVVVNAIMMLDSTNASTDTYANLDKKFATDNVIILSLKNV